nr:hypothetical protein [Tanacetum cinerariifolium]
MSVSMKNLTKNDQQGVSQKAAAQNKPREACLDAAGGVRMWGSVAGSGGGKFGGDGGVSRVSLSVVSSSDDKNGEIGGWPDAGSSDGSDSASDVGE